MLASLPGKHRRDIAGQNQDCHLANGRHQGTGYVAVFNRAHIASFRSSQTMLTLSNYFCIRHIDSSSLRRISSLACCPFVDCAATVWLSRHECGRSAGYRHSGLGLENSRLLRHWLCPKSHVKSLSVGDCCRIFAQVWSHWPFDALRGNFSLNICTAFTTRHALHDLTLTYSFTLSVFHILLIACSGFAMFP